MEKKDVLPLLGGALTTGAIDGVLEMIFDSDPAKWSGKFPYIETINPLPPVDDWIVLGIPAVTYAIGHYKKREDVKAFGLGGLLYAGGMFLHHIILRTRRMTGITFAHELPLGQELPIPQIKEI